MSLHGNLRERKEAISEARYNESSKTAQDRGFTERDFPYMLN